MLVQRKYIPTKFLEDGIGQLQIVQHVIMDNQLNMTYTEPRGSLMVQKLLYQALNIKGLPSCP